METKNVIYKNFDNKADKLIQKKLNRFLNLKNLISKYPLLKSLKSDYQYSYKKNFLKILNKNIEFNIIGMGGSILGTQSIYDFLKHKINKKFFFFDNLKSYKNLKTKKKRLNIIISKSGNTLETFSNLNLILTHQKNNNNLIITEKKKSILNDLANKLKIDVIEHKNYIGGRYSVLSEVGMLPAELMGLKEKKFKKLNDLVKKKTFTNFLIKNVISIYKNIQKGKRNSVILNYDESSDNFLKWYQQLSAESLGKNNKGIFPIISTMPKDNHSLLQLYLDGPKNNFYTFFSVKNKNNFKYNTTFMVDSFKNLKNKNDQEVLYAQKNATENVFRKKKIPFRSFDIRHKKEDTLGELFTFFILETLLLSNLLKVNPINQPSVELIKTETRKILN